MTLDEFTEIHNIFQKGIFEVSAQRKFLACPESENFAFDSYKEKNKTSSVKRKVTSLSLDALLKMRLLIGCCAARTTIGG